MQLHAYLDVYGEDLFPFVIRLMLLTRLLVSATQEFSTRSN